MSSHFSGLNDLVFKLLAEKLRIFGSKILKWLQVVLVPFHLYQEGIYFGSEVPFVNAKELTMRKPLHKTKELETHLFFFF